MKALSRSLLLIGAIFLALFSLASGSSNASNSSVIEPASEGPASTVTVGVYGARRDQQKQLLSSLLGVNGTQVNDDLYAFRHGAIAEPISARILPDHAVAQCSLAMVFLDRPTVLNEEATLFRLVAAFRSLRSGRPDSTDAKLPLVVVLSGKATMGLVEDLQALINDAWTRASNLDSRNVSTDDLSSHLLLVADEKTVTASASRAMTSALASATPLPAGNGSTESVAMASLSFHSDRRLPSVEEGKLALACREGTVRALRKGLLVASDMVADLNADHSASPETFRACVQRVLREAEKELKDFEQAQTANLPVSPEARAEALHRATKDLRRRILLATERFYERQLLLLRSAVLAAFNKEVVDVDISTEIMAELHAMRTATLSKYSAVAETLRCPEAASVWDPSTYVTDLKAILDQYLAAREVGFRLLGVLPRGRKPIDIGVHVLLPHLLGRDHSQDPLGMVPGDVPTHAQHVTRVRILTAAEVRDQTQSEFAREMVMLPLSVSAPSQEPRGPRQRPRAKLPPREPTGAERALRWDVEPMPDALQGLQHLADRHGKAHAERSWIQRLTGRVTDRIAGRLLPGSSTKRYVHPKYNYGASQSAGAPAGAEKEKEASSKPAFGGWLATVSSRKR